jgi:hypothetical protein
MTPKEKAIELVDKFYQRFPLIMDVITTRGDLSWEYNGWKEAKQCALIAVDEILRSHHNLYGVNSKQVKFYSEVQQEIELL